VLAGGEAILAAVQAAESQTLAPARVVAHPNGVHRIQASRRLVPVNFRELWHGRELVGFFVLRDVKSRYRQTYLGPVWALLRPLMSIVVFSVIFGGLAHIETDSNIPYALWVTPAVLAFGYVSTALTTTSTSLLTNSNLITKVYFPRLYVPLASTLTPVVDFLIGFVVLLALFLYYHRVPSWHVVFLPAFLALAALVVVGVGLWLSSFTARYRDAVFGVPYVVQIWQYATPVIYPVTFIPSRYRWLIDLNPFTAVVNGFRWSLLGQPFGSLAALGASILIAVGITLSGLFIFRSTERVMVDML
jgi:lipopolysaccharide transport system permease protein